MKDKKVVDFENYVVWIFGQKQNLQCTKSGQSYVPLCKPSANASKMKE